MATKYKRMAEGRRKSKVQTTTEEIAYKILTSMALAIALRTISMLDIETLDRVLDKSYLICTFQHVRYSSDLLEREG